MSDYLQERYGNLSYKNADLVSYYTDYLKKNQIEVFTEFYGFFTGHKKGDAFIVYDVFVKPEYRSKHYSKAVFSECRAKALTSGASVVIGFTEHAGQNQHLGRRTLENLDFVKAFSTDIGNVYVRGVN